MTVQNPPIFVQEGSHPAEDTRRALEALAAGTSGYSSASALAVTERASLTNMSVDVAGGGVWVPGTEGTFQGSYFCDNRGTTNLAIAAADPTNPRIDLVVAQVEDSEYSGAVDQWSLTVITGTPALSPTIPSAPANSVSLATVAVAGLATAITNADINDLRDLSQTTHGNVSIPGDLVVNGDVTATSDVSVVGNTSVGGDLTVTGNLTASNQGLVLVKTQTIGSGVSSVTVTDAFSATFYNYRVILSSISATTVDYLRLQFPGYTSSGYYFNRLTLFANNATGLTNSSNGYDSGYVDIGTSGTSRQAFVSLDIYAPAVALRTGLGGTFYGSGYNGIVNGEHSSSVAHTALTLTVASGTFTAGEISIYGYNYG